MTTLLDALLAGPDEHTLLFGVRHHSPACARALIEAAREWRPEAVAVELPADLQPLVQWLGHPETVAPVAVAVAGAEGTGFYPFADFSPELAILRWARRHDIPVHCLDLPVGVGVDIARGPEEEGSTETFSQEAWDTRVEARAPGQTWRQVRRAALAVGLGVRLTAGTPDAHTHAREEHMRTRLASLRGTRTLVVVGAYHCAALLEPADTHPLPAPGAAVSLVPYSFAQLDSRSGYASGIRDPRWQQGIHEGEEHLAATVLTEVARAMRGSGEPAGAGEIVEATRMATDLARLRGLPQPGRREVIEALTSVFAQGSVLGRGRSVARALQQVMIGDRRGRLPADAPVPALLTQVQQLLHGLGLPLEERRQIRIDPFQGGRQLTRHTVLAQLTALGVPYERARTGGQIRGLDTRSYTVTCEFSTATAGALAVCTAGATLEQAVENTLSHRLARWEGDAAELLDLLGTVLACALPRPVHVCLDLIEGDLAPRAGFATALEAAHLLLGPATALLPESLRERSTRAARRLSEAVIRELPGIAGSEDPADALRLAGVAGLLPAHRTRATATLRRISSTGSPLMRGAATAVLGEGDVALLGSWVDQTVAGGNAARSLSGFLLASRGTWCEDPLLDGVISRVEHMGDRRFLAALPRLRAAFDPIPPAERERFLDRLGPVPPLAADPATLAANAAVDLAVGERLAALGLRDLSFTPGTRWRLVLGAEPETLSGQAQRLADALDELYGDPGEDPSGESDGRVGAGRAPGAVSVRDWGEEIRVLFGEEHLQEILGQAAARGRAEAVEYLQPESVRPSVELLATMLSLRGALPESRLARIRPLIARVVEDLSASLARDLTPVLRGAAAGVPTRRPSPALDMAATVRRNLRHVVAVDGRPRIVPVTPWFRAPEVRTSPWHIIVVVDVSGSMEASTVYAAMTAAILTGVRTYRVSFLTFDTSVVDLSGHVADPLQLLLEISVGGGTDIARALTYAAQLVQVPARTAMILVTDFEEYGPVSELVHRVRSLAESGVHLIGCAALNDSGEAVHNVAVAQQVAAAGMRVASLSPLQLARWVGEVLR